MNAISAAWTVFDGKWKEFGFHLKTAVGSVNTTMRAYFDEIQKGGKDPDCNTIFADGSDQDIVRVTGEALVVLRGVPNGQSVRFQDMIWLRVVKSTRKRTRG